MAPSELVGPDDGKHRSQMRRTTDQHESADAGGEESTRTFWLCISILVSEIRVSAGPKSTLSVKVAIGAETASAVNASIGCLHG